MRGSTLQEVPAVELAQAGHAGQAELEDRDPAARAQHPHHLAAGRRGLLHVADAEGDGHARRPSRRPPAGASRRRAPAARAATARPRRPCRGRAAASPRRSPRRRPAPAPGRCRAAPIATSAVPVQTSSSRSRAGQRQRLDGAAPPVAVEAGREQPVEQVVARGDRVEHPGDARRRLVERLRPRRRRDPAQSTYSDDRGGHQVEDADVAVEVEGLGATCDRSPADTSDCS